MNFVVALFLLAAALVYATVGQAGGTAFLAVMAVAAMPVSELRRTAQALNIVAASYATGACRPPARSIGRCCARLRLPPSPPLS